MNDLTLPDPVKFDLLSPLERRAAILQIEQFALSRAACEGEHSALRNCGLLHYRAPGAYAREFLAPAGAVCIGKIHRHAHINVLALGRCAVYTEDGYRELAAPMTFVSSPGTKRVVVAHTEIAWTTVHVTDKETLAEIEEEMIATSFDQLPFEPMEVLS